METIPKREPSLDTQASDASKIQAPGTAGEPAKKAAAPLRDRILKAGLFVLIAHFCVKASGFVMQWTMVNSYGDQGFVISDVFTVVYDTVLGTAFMIGEQCLAPAYLPLFTQARDKEGESRAWDYTSTLFNLQFIILIITIAVLMLKPAMVIGTLTQWDSPHVKFTTTAKKEVSGDLLSATPEGYTVRTDEGAVIVYKTEELSEPAKLDKEMADRIERKHMAETMLFWMAPGLLGMSLASLSYVLLNGYKEFFFAAFGDAVLKLSVLAGALLGAFIGRDWRFIALGGVLGGTAKLVTHLCALGVARLRQYRIKLNLRDPYVREFALLVLPLLAGIVLSRWRDAVLVNVLTAKPKLPSYIKMARQITDVISFLIPYTLSIALLPYFCDISARDDRKQLGEVLTRIIKMLVWFFVPVTIVLAFAALPVGLVVFGGKQVGAAEGKYVASAIELYSLQLPFLAVEMMVMQAFFSSRRTIAPTIAGLVFSTIAALVPYYMYQNGMLPGEMDLLVAVALAIVIARALKAITLVGLLQSTVPVLPAADAFQFSARIAIVGGTAAVAAWQTSHVAAKVFAFGGENVPQLKKHLGHGLECLAVAGVGGAVYLVLSVLLKMDEPRLFWQWTQEKLKRRRPAEPLASAP